MKISGFTLVRNGTAFDYPYLESLRSLLPLVDELIVNVGKGDDDTLEQIQKFATQEGQGKVTYFESDWQLDQPEKKRGGLILSKQTCQFYEKHSIGFTATRASRGYSSNTITFMDLLMSFKNPEALIAEKFVQFAEMYTPKVLETPKASEKAMEASSL